MSDIVGRKAVLFFAIATFLVGSALCGAAQNFVWLAVCECLDGNESTKLDTYVFSGRGVQGLGGGGILQVVQIIIADISTSFWNSEDEILRGL